MRALALLLLSCAPLQAAAAPRDRIPVIVTLAGHLDVAAFRDGDKHVRRARLVEALQARARLTQGPLQRWLRSTGATHVRPLWLINGVAATVTPAIWRALRWFPGVVRVVRDLPLRAPPTGPGTVSTPEWNLDAVHAPELWARGFDGAGVVVANLDTGVDLAHADLQAKWRGGADSWWDPYAHTATPYDAIGHGTETMGILLGGASGGTVLGVAPGARWIAAKIYDDHGNTSVSVIHEAFQWLLMPGGSPGAPDAPDVVNASWDLAAVNACDTTFQPDFEALRAAGIVVVFAAGNSGPNVWTSVSPANNPDGFSAGAVDDTLGITSFSSRGASSCTNGIFPDTVAPGANLKTASISLGGTPQYTYVSGTSFSAPHVAGVAALLMGAFPQATVADIEKVLRSTALDLGPAGPDDTYGHGLVDAAAAYDALAAGP